MVKLLEIFNIILKEEQNLSNRELEIIRKIVKSNIKNGECNSKGGASCGVTSEEISKVFDWDMTYGNIFDNDDNLLDDDHAWVIKPDGTIIDATIEQFSHILSDWPGYNDIAVIPKGHPFTKHYENLGQL